MGKRGPARKPVAEKELDGSYRDDRDGGTLRLRPGIPPKPNWLDEVASAIWDQTIDNLSQKEGLLSDADGPALALYCDAWRQYHEFDELIRNQGITSSTLTGGLKSHPLIPARKAARDDAIRIGALFGLSPSHRASMKITTTDTNDEAADLIA